MAELPKGWVLTRVGEACIELVGGGTPSRNNAEYFRGNIIWLTPTEIPKEKIVIINDSKEKITERGLRNSSARIIPKNSVLLTSRASIGYVAIAGCDLTTNQGFASFVCSDAIFNFYLAYWLWANKNMLEANATGTTFKEIAKSKIREFYFPLPPLPEQHRIVEKIEELFTELDGGVEALKKVKAQLKRYRRAVLKYAFEGKLVNLEIDDLRLKDWGIKGLKEVTTIIMGQSPPGNTYNKDRMGLPFFQGKTDFGKIYPTPSTWCTSPKKLAQPDDILISVRAPVGPTNLCNIQCCIGRGLAAIRPLPNIDTLYVFYYLRSIEHLISEMGTGSTFSAVSKSQIENLEIPLPPLPEQHQIVSEIERRFSVADEVEKVVENSLKQAQRLRQSILKRAFEGRLVPQDPNDEPAGKLLEKIKKEREQDLKTNKPRRKGVHISG